MAVNPLCKVTGIHSNVWGLLKVFLPSISFIVFVFLFQLFFFLLFFFFLHRDWRWFVSPSPSPSSSVPIFTVIVFASIWPVAASAALCRPTTSNLTSHPAIAFIKSAQQHSPIGSPGFGGHVVKIFTQPVGDAFALFPWKVVTSH